MGVDGFLPFFDSTPLTCFFMFCNDAAILRFFPRGGMILFSANSATLIKIVFRYIKKGDRGVGDDDPFYNERAYFMCFYLLKELYEEEGFVF